MQSFREFEAGTILEGQDLQLNILGIIKTFNGSSEVEIEDEYIATTVPSKEQLDRILDAIPDDLDYDVLVTSIGRDFEGTRIKPSEDSDPDEAEYEIDEDDVSAYDAVFDLIIYTYNMEDLTEEQLDEVKRTIKVNAKGKRRIKMKCRKGYKFDGRKCVKIAGKELMNKRRAIRKAVRTKRAKGSGYTKRIVRLRRRAMKKRTGMGLR